VTVESKLTYMTVAESKIKNRFLFRLYRVLGECSEDEDSFHYSVKGSTTKVDDLGVELLSSDEENCVLVVFIKKKKFVYK
jgi:hypothetical protein